MMFVPVIYPMSHQAEIFAAAAHAAINQRRKYNGLPYIMHPRAVTSILFHEGVVKDEVLAAAMLHDVLEDTAMTEEDLRREFAHFKACELMISYIVGLTNFPRTYGHRSERKAADRGRLALCSKEVHTIKCADIIDNSKSISKLDPKFGLTYLRESLLTLKVLDKACQRLHDRAVKSCHDELNAIIGCPEEEPDFDIGFHRIIMELKGTGRDYAIPMIEAIKEKSKNDQAYRAYLYLWFTKGGSSLLRDELCLPFISADFVEEMPSRDRFPFHQMWTAIDTVWYNLKKDLNNGILDPQ